MTREEIKGVVSALFDDFGSGRWDDPDFTFRSMAEDGDWWVAGSLPVSGIASKAKMMAGMKQVARVAAGGLRMTPTSWIIEGDRVAVEVRSEMHLKDGRVYKNQYHFSMIVRDGKIVKIREYIDTYHLAEIIHAGPLAVDSAG